MEPHSNHYRLDQPMDKGAPSHIRVSLPFTLSEWVLSREDGRTEVCVYIKRFPDKQVTFGDISELDF